MRDGKFGEARRRLAIRQPCSQRWEDLEGDDRVRFCGACGRDVHNLEALTPAEVVALAEREERVCRRAPPAAPSRARAGTAAMTLLLASACGDAPTPSTIQPAPEAVEPAPPFVGPPAPEPTFVGPPAPLPEAEPEVVDTQHVASRIKPPPADWRLREELLIGF